MARRQAWSARSRSSPTDWLPFSRTARKSPSATASSSGPRTRRRRRADDGAMNEAGALDIVQVAIWTVLTSAGPAVAVAMLVGIVIALIQALTQIQEITLTFVPKIVTILIVVAFSGS